jgi:hypothetical protein
MRERMCPKSCGSSACNKSQNQPKKNPPKNDPNEPKYKVFLESINPKADPCDDFYQFACGKEFINVYKLISNRQLHQKTSGKFRHG